MAYNIIADLGEYITNYPVNNKCNILTLDNEIMLCEDIVLSEYNAGDTILTLSSPKMFPTNDIYIPCGITEIKENLLSNSETFDPSLSPYTNSHTAIVSGALLDGVKEYRAGFASADYYIQIDFPQLEIGKEYYFQFDCARDTTTTTQASQSFAIIDNVYYPLGRLESGVWVRKQAKFTATANTTSAIVRLGFQSQTTSFAGFFKNFSLSETPIDEWFDGIKAFHDVSLIKVDSQGNLSLMEDMHYGILRLNGICFQVNDSYYNHSIGNVNVIPSSPYGVR